MKTPTDKATPRLRSKPGDRMKQIINGIDISTKIILAFDHKTGDGLIEEKFDTTAGELSAAGCGTCEAEDGIASWGQRSVFERIKQLIIERRKLTAVWDGLRYVCGEWASENGDDWITGDGRPVTGQEFLRASITLIDGPLSGKVVA